MDSFIYTKFRIFILTVSFVTILIPPGRLDAVDSTAIKAIFADPPREYHSGPLWVWNDRLTEEQIIDTLRDLAGQQVKQAFVHPRPGLMTPYLSKEWFDLWKVALKEAERLDMNIWIYDENSYPSGFAGGFVPEAMPESRGRGLHLAEVKQTGKPGDDVFAVYRLTADGYENVTPSARAGEKLPEGRYLVATWRLAPEGGWYGGKYYVDLLKPGVTEKFIEITFEAYRRQIGEHFGRRVPGIFTDEPHPFVGALPWNEHLSEQFQKRWGYRLEDHLPAMARPVGDWKKVRHNYYKVILEQFIKRWGKPCHDFCEKNNLEFTGHYWEHGWPSTAHGPDNMAMYAWHQRPAIDTLMNQYREDTNAQFGNVRSVKELSSVANQLGRKRTLCEAYGAGGWDLRFEDMKRIGDWLYVLGVNTLNEHLSYITIRGARKRDHPQSFSYHEPWWDSYHVMAQYFARLSLVMSQGEQINRILIVEPTTTAWMYQGENHLNEVGNSFQQMLVALERAQVEYDVGSEDIIARHGSIVGPLFRVGQRAYDTVVLPPLTENLNLPTMDLLEDYLKAGGVAICCGPIPSCVNGQPSNRCAEASKHPGWKQAKADDTPRMLLADSKDGFAVERDPGDEGILFHHRRTVEDGEFLLLVNTSIDSPSTGWIKSAMRSVEKWDPATAEISTYPFEQAGTGIKTRFELAPCGSLVLFLSEKKGKPIYRTEETIKIMPLQGKLEIHPVEENVLTLDFVDITAGGETKKDIYFYKANQFAFQKSGMARNPWDSAVQFRDELITKTFSSDSGFEATYRFTIRQQIPKRLAIVIERPDLYTISCNGQTVVSRVSRPRSEGGTPSTWRGRDGRDTEWWLDKAFGRIDIAQVAKVGENRVTLKASPFTIYHELEPAYLLGTFTLHSVDSGFVVTGGSKPIKLGSWKKQGYPFYATGVSYKQTFGILQPSGRYLVELPKWYGSVAKVNVNGKSAGYIAYQPWQCDVADLIQPGANTIEVIVVGTLKNTLGPHHNGPGVGSAWPAMFQKGPDTGPPPGEHYHTLDYGLFEPFVLKQMIEK
ncbi:MAG: hypothetical protein JXM79_05805 [Sedimentisphaerales bacterium]|nr:hypothetical protein [Sedimentisphaerales bacterium]